MRLHSFKACGGGGCTTRSQRPFQNETAMITKYLIMLSDAWMLSPEK